jgi:hypothetical protein
MLGTMFGAFLVLGNIVFLRWLERRKQKWGRDAE